MMAQSPGFPALLQDFFSERLIAQRQASPRTVASYRDTFRLFLHYAQERTKKPASMLTLVELDAPLILGFLDHLERERHNHARTRNARLSALRSFLHYAALHDPTTLSVIQRSLAIPTKRFDRPRVGFLSREETEALLAAPDRSTWSGHRDHVLLATMYNTGARVSEIITLRIGDVVVDQSPSISLHDTTAKNAPYRSGRVRPSDSRSGCPECNPMWRRRFFRTATVEGSRALASRADCEPRSAPLQRSARR